MASSSETFLQLDAHFITGVTRPTTWRRKQLEGLHDLIQENTDSLVKAALQDSRLVPGEVLLELTSILSLIRTSIQTLITSNPSTKSATVDILGLYKQRQKITKLENPVGVVLINSHWAFPYSTTLGSLAFALVAGNVAAVLPPPTLSSTLPALLSKYLDQLAYAILTPSSLSKPHLHNIEALPSPSITPINIHPSSGSISLNSSSSSTNAGLSAVYVNETALKLKSAKAIASDIVQAKVAFNGASNFTPSIVFVDESVYEDVVKEITFAAREYGIGRTGGGEEVKRLVESLVENGAKVLSSGVLYVVEDDSRKLGKINGSLPFLMVTRVPSPDTAIDRIQGLSRLSGFYLYVHHPKFSKYITKFIDSTLTLTNSIPPHILLSSSSPTLSLSQTIITTTPSPLASPSTDKLRDVIRKANIGRLRVDEGPGTRMDFFEQVKLAYRSVQVVGVLSVGLGVWGVYRRFTR
ncbi:hypothetical protein JAAARDRAFT_42013 [Jaapia argillacea MUCL 33604]|uniref:Aldehyde dehydrogenase domain-containing protein n=1 Tax=Jaapia argillacea MUCL 33604 TaxID=933084 RepID=A0A067PJB7_9AGAM|nr:hypothetical protein JAAARDRAFT_42013 [Jaapia argillacea MUCL 33604]